MFEHQLIIDTTITELNVRQHVLQKAGKELSVLSRVTIRTNDDHVVKLALSCVSDVFKKVDMLVLEGRLEERAMIMAVQGASAYKRLLFLEQNDDSVVACIAAVKKAINFSTLGLVSVSPMIAETTVANAGENFTRLVLRALSPDAAKAAVTAMKGRGKQSFEEFGLYKMKPDAVRSAFEALQEVNSCKTLGLCCLDEDAVDAVITSFDAYENSFTDVVLYKLDPKAERSARVWCKTKGLKTEIIPASTSIAEIRDSPIKAGGSGSLPLQQKLAAGTVVEAPTFK